MILKIKSKRKVKDKGCLTMAIKEKNTKKDDKKPLITRVKECLSMADFWDMKEEIIKELDKKKGAI